MSYFIPLSAVKILFISVLQMRKQKLRERLCELTKVTQPIGSGSKIGTQICLPLLLTRILYRRVMFQVGFRPENVCEISVRFYFLKGSLRSFSLLLAVQWLRQTSWGNLAFPFICCVTGCEVLHFPDPLVPHLSTGSSKVSLSMGFVMSYCGMLQYIG